MNSGHVYDQAERSGRDSDFRSGMLVCVFNGRTVRLYTGMFLGAETWEHGRETYFLFAERQGTLMNIH